MKLILALLLILAVVTAVIVILAAYHVRFVDQDGLEAEIEKQREARKAKA